MIYGSVCSGIEAATVAWKPLGWQPAFFSEIEKFPRRVLQHHYPEVPLHGDFTTIEGNEYGSVDLLCGGTPCQSFSVAGKRLGMDDPRGNLSIEFALLAKRLNARWLFWENVPGVLSSNEGRDFAAFISILGQCGYGFAYRIFDSQYFGVPQRRRRVFLVGYFGDWRPAAAVLFEPEGLRGDSPPRREAGQKVAGTFTARSCRSIGAQDAAADHIIPETSHTLRAEGFDASEDGTGRGIPLIPEVTGALMAETHPGSYSGQDAYTGKIIPVENRFKKIIAPTLTASNDPSRSPQSTEITNQVAAVLAASDSVRRLTPRECERLQAFPDDYTAIPNAADGPRYKAVGNTWTTKPVQWIGRRIDVVDRLLLSQKSRA